MLCLRVCILFLCVKVQLHRSVFLLTDDAATMHYYCDCKKSRAKFFKDWFTLF